MQRATQATRLQERTENSVGTEQDTRAYHKYEFLVFSLSSWSYSPADRLRRLLPNFARRIRFLGDLFEQVLN